MSSRAGYTLEAAPLKAATLASVVFLAWSATATLSPLLQRRAAPESTWTINVVSQSRNAASETELILDNLIVDGRRLRSGSIQVSGQWETWDAFRHLRYPDGSGPASITFRGAHIIVELRDPRSLHRLSIAREHDTVVERITGDSIAYARAGFSVIRGSVGHFRLEFPAKPAALWSFWLFLPLFAGVAALVAPWRSERSQERWLIVNQAAILATMWLTQSVITEDDSQGYLDGVRYLFDFAFPTYYPPGTSLLVALANLVPLGGLGNRFTLLQALMMLLSAIWLYRLIQPNLPGAAAFPIVLIVSTALWWLEPPRAVLSETLAVFGILGSLYYFEKAVQRRSIAAGVLGGLLAGWAGLARVVPLAAILPAVGLLWWLRREPGWARPVTAFAATIAVVLATPMAWFAVHGNQFALSSGSGYHLYNRVVYAQRLLATDGPATRSLVQLLDGTHPASDQHWVIREKLRQKGLSWEETNDLMGRVAVEGIASAPLAFVGFSFKELFRLLMMPGRLNPFAVGDNVSPSIENGPPLGFSASAWRWREKMAAVQDELWPWLAWLSVLAIPVLVVQWRQSYALLAVAVAAFGHLTGIVFTESINGRYIIPIQPFLATVALSGLVLAVTRVASRFRRART